MRAGHEYPEAKARFLIVSIPKYETALDKLVTLWATPKKALLLSCKTFADIATSC
jgi:hypothetical protein